MGLLIPLRFSTYNGCVCVSARPSTSAARVLSSAGHSPVTSLCWQPSGQLLVSGSATSTCMMVGHAALLWQHINVYHVFNSVPGTCRTGACLVCLLLQVWDVGLGAAVSLRRWGGGGVSLVRFSPEGSKLFAGCPSSTFRIWECQNWGSDTWNKITGRVKVLSEARVASLKS